MWQIVGQTKAVSSLQRSIERRMVAHAYLFIGPPHVGKMTLAIDLAQALNCEADERPCGVCGPCKKIISGKHTDVQVIGLVDHMDYNETRPRTEIGIDQIREMQHSCSLPPFEGKYKIFIIDRAEKLSGEAANCLLKSLEEPAERVIFILLTISDGLIPNTVVSRCQRIELLPLVNKETETTLDFKGVIEEQNPKLLARLSHGCLGWAISATSDSSLLSQRAERITEMIDIINGDCERRFNYAAKLADKFGQDREIVWQILDLWLDWWRDLLLVKLECMDAIINIDFEIELVKMAKSYELVQMRKAVSSILQTKEQLGENASSRLAIELLMLDIPRRS